MKTSIHVLIIYRLVLIRMRNISYKICRENLNTFCVPLQFFKNRSIYEIMSKNIVEVEQEAGDNMAHAHCLLDTKATNTLTLYNNHCFSTAKVVAGTRLNTTLHVHWLYCY